MSAEGPKLWRRGHGLAIGYPDAPTDYDRSRAYMELWALIADLPCSICQNHATAHVRRFPPDLSGSRGYQQWWFRFHNTVNRRLGKPLFTYEAYLEEYKSELATTRTLKGGQGLGARC